MNTYTLRQGNDEITIDARSGLEARADAYELTGKDRWVVVPSSDPRMCDRCRIARHSGTCEENSDRLAAESVHTFAAAAQDEIDNDFRDAHLEGLGQLGFVHEWLAASDPNSGRWFVPSGDFGKQTRIRAVVGLGAEGSDLYVFAAGGQELAYTIHFDAPTPSNVINQSVAAAMRNL